MWASSAYSGRKVTKKEEQECETDFERWTYVLKNMETLNRMPFKARKAVFQKLEHIVDIAALSKEDRMKYDESIRIYRDQLVVEAYARQQEEKRVKEASEEAWTKGIAAGERNKQLQIARRIKEKGFSDAEVAEMTGLSVEDLRNL